MPYTPPSISPSGLHPVPVRSSSSYAGLANGHPPPSLKQPPPPPRTHKNYHGRPTNHHRRSSGPSSPPREPIPVASFATDRPSPTRPSSVRRTSSSSTDSDEDEDNGSMHSRDSKQLHDLEKLRDAIREQLPQRKTASPPGSPDHRYISNSVLSPTDNLPPLDANSGRYDSTTSDGEHSSSTTPPDHDIEFPRMVRKKSGEVVKSSLKTACLKRRPLSLPCTPVYPKAVHFDTKLEHVRHFVHSEKPLAVSTDTSPSGEHVDFPFDKELSEEQYQIELPNFPSNEESNRRDLPVRVDSVFLASNGRNLIGNVIVKNIAFNKWVAVRFTFDHWRTISEVSATYDSTQDNGTTPKDPAWDRFTFSIKLVDFTNLENRQMLFCVRYNVIDQEYWDNNYGSNYRVEFRKRPNHLLRRSPHPPNVNGLYHRASDDSAIGEDFDIDISPETFAKDLAKQITSPRSALLANLGESPQFVKKTTSSPFPPLSSNLANGTPQKRLTGKAFANRYDFEASLSAAIATANAAIAAERSGLQKTSSPKIISSSHLYFPPLPPLFRPTPPVESPIEVVKEVNLVNNIKKTHLSGLQQNHHFRSRSYPLGTPAQSLSSTMEDAWGGYISDEGAEKPPMDSSSYLDFISSYCFFEPGKSENPHNPVLEKKEAPPTSEQKSLTPTQFPSVRATTRSPPPSPRKLSPIRTKHESKPTKFASYVEYTGSSDSNQSSPESSTSSSPRVSPQFMLSPERPRDHSRDPSPSMRFHHHRSLGFDIPGAPSTALVT